MPKKKMPATAFAERLYKLRSARGLTQTQLAEAIGSNQRMISYYENHADFPPAAVVIDLAKALRVSTDELLGVRPSEVAEPGGNREKKRLWKKFQKLLELPEKDQRAVIRLINSLASAHSVRKRNTC